MKGIHQELKLHRKKQEQKHQDHRNKIFYQHNWDCIRKQEQHLEHEQELEQAQQQIDNNKLKVINAMKNRTHHSGRLVSKQAV